MRHRRWHVWDATLFGDHLYAEIKFDWSLPVGAKYVVRVGRRIAPGVTRVWVRKDYRSARRLAQRELNRREQRASAAAVPQARAA